MALALTLAAARITSYNVCYTKLLRSSTPRSARCSARSSASRRSPPRSRTRPVITSYSIHYTKLYDAAAGLKVLPDAGLLAEVAGLVEWPVVLKGTIDDAFMSVPREVLSTSMRTHP